MRILPRRLFNYPRVVVRRPECGDGDATRVVLSIEGLVCDVCATRAQRALEGLPGATAAEVDLESGAASVTFAGPPASEGAISRAVDGVVLLRPARRFSQRLIRLWLRLTRISAIRRGGVRKADSRRTPST